MQENLRRIFIHPHGFYIDLRDKRKIPVSQTILLAVLISLGLGLVGATFCYFFRENLLFDHLLTLLTTSDNFKHKLISLCWKPDIAVLIFSILFLTAFLMLAIFIKLFAFIFRKTGPQRVQYEWEKEDYEPDDFDRQFDDQGVFRPQQEDAGVSEDQSR